MMGQGIAQYIGPTSIRLTPEIEPEFHIRADDLGRRGLDPSQEPIPRRRHGNIRTGGLLRSLLLDWLTLLYLLLRLSLRTLRRLTILLLNRRLLHGRLHSLLLNRLLPGSLLDLPCSFRRPFGMTWRKDIFQPRINPGAELFLCL